MSKNEMSNKKFEELITKYGSVEKFSKVLYEGNVIPGNPIVFDDYTIPVAELARCLNCDLKTTINKYLESKFNEREMIEKLEYNKLTKNEIINMLSYHVLDSFISSNENQQFATTLLKGSRENDENQQFATTVQNRSREIIGFKQISETNNNPIYSDGARKIQISNNGSNVVSYALAVYMCKFIETDEANLVILNLMDATAEKVIYKHAYMQTVTASLDEMKNLAKEGKTFDLNNLLIILETFTDVSKLLYRDELDSVANRLFEIYKIYEDGKFRDKLGLIRNTMASIKDCENQIRKVMNKMDKTISEMNRLEEYNKKDCIPMLSNENYRQYISRIGKLNSALEKGKYIHIYKYEVSKEDGSTSPKSKTVATKEKPWVFDKDIVITGTNKSTTFKLTHFGKFVFENLYNLAQRYINNEIDLKTLSSATREDLQAKYIKQYMSDYNIDEF